MSNKFYDLLRESVLVQALITFLLGCVICYLAVVGKPIPEMLTTAFMVIIGFYFGQKVQTQSYIAGKLSKQL